jgi:hypothetical protein
MQVSQASLIVGGLSRPSKMPCHSFSLPARDTCPIGDLLAKHTGTVCALCYADNRGRYAMPSTHIAQHRRLRILKRAIWLPRLRARWIDAMVTLVSRDPFFRWHDSGDIFSQAYLDLILDVIELTPGTKHWLPTKEIGIVSRNRERILGLENLTLRVSEFLIGINGRKGRGFNTSSVSANVGVDCKAPSQGGECKDCRACWDIDIKNINYKLH